MTGLQHTLRSVGHLIEMAVDMMISVCV